MKRIAVLLLILFCTALSLVACDSGRQQAQSKSALEKVLENNRLRVGFSTFVPWAMKNKQGEFVGFEIDVARKLASDMGVEVQFVPTKWSGIIPALLTGKFDIIIGGMGITPERNLKVNFTRPYEYSGMSILAHSERAGRRTTVDEFNKPGNVVVARIGTTAAMVAKKMLPNAEIRLFDDEGQALQEVLNGQADALVASQPFPEFQVLKYPDKIYLPLSGATFTREPIGFAIRKGDADFLNYLDNWIRVKNADGWLMERYRYWFTTDDWKAEIE